MEPPPSGGPIGMSHPVFFRLALRPSLADVVAWTGARVAPGADLAAKIVEDVAPLEEAGRTALAFFDNPKYLDALRTTRAMACFIARRFVTRVPKSTIALLTETPYRDFALVLARLYPDAV